MPKRKLGQIPATPTKSGHVKENTDQYATAEQTDKKIAKKRRTELNVALLELFNEVAGEERVVGNAQEEDEQDELEILLGLLNPDLPAPLLEGPHNTPASPTPTNVQTNGTPVAVVAVCLNAAEQNAVDLQQEQQQQIFTLTGNPAAMHGTAPATPQTPVATAATAAAAAELTTPAPDDNEGALAGLEQLGTDTNGTNIPSESPQYGTTP